MEVIKEDKELVNATIHAEKRNIKQREIISISQRLALGIIFLNVSINDPYINSRETFSA